jgi:hypothetical protein
MCVFVMLFVGDLQLQPHKHPQSTCFQIFVLVFLITLSRFAFCFVMFCFVQVLSFVFQSKGAHAIATMIPPCL